MSVFSDNQLRKHKHTTKTLLKIVSLVVDFVSLKSIVELKVVCLPLYLCNMCSTPSVNFVDLILNKMGKNCTNYLLWLSWSSSSLVRWPIAFFQPKKRDHRWGRMPKIQFHFWKWKRINFHLATCQFQRVCGCVMDKFGTMLHAFKNEARTITYLIPSDRISEKQK